MADERLTNFYVDYDIQDVTAARDSNFSTPNPQQYFTNITKLVDRFSPDIEFPRFTFEHNFNVLDGSLRPLEVDTQVPITVPYFNTVLSDANGNYATAPSILINFTRPHSSFAFMFYFIDNHPIEMELTFWDPQDMMISKFTCNVDSLIYTTFHDVYGYQKMQIRFTKTIPKRYVKLKYIKYGAVITWDETNVKDANIVQQVDRMSKSLTIDTMSFTVIDVMGRLNLGNAAGMHRYFQRNQVMYPYEVIEKTNTDGSKTTSTIELGKYYLKTFSEGKNLGKMSSQSYLGLMDDIIYYGGEIYNGKKAGLVIKDIFYTMGLEDDQFSIDSVSYNQLLYGTIIPKSCRKALNEVLFAIHSVIDSHNLEHIEIKKSTSIQKPDLVKAYKFSTSTKKNNYVYGVDIKYKSFGIESARKEVAKGTYTTGTYTLYFTAPYSGLIIDAGTYHEGGAEYPVGRIISQTTYSVTFSMHNTAEATISGYGYTVTESIARATQNDLQAGEKESIQTFSTSLVNGTQALELADKLLEYLSYDLTINVKMLADDNNMEDFHIVENPVDRFNNYYGMFTKRTLNLTGGFIDTATLIGSTIQEPMVPFARSANYELFAGGTNLI